MVQNSRPLVPRPEMVQGGHGTCGSGSARKPMMSSPPQGLCLPPQQNTPRTTHKAPNTPLSSRVTSMSHEQSSNSSTTNTLMPGRTFRGRQTGSNVQTRNQNAAQSPHTGPGCNVSPGYDNLSRGMGAAMHSPQSKTGGSSYGQTPPHRGHDPRYGTPRGNHRTTPGSSVRTPTMHGRGRDTGMGHAQREHTPAAGHAQRHQTPVAGHAQRQQTPVAGHAQRQQTPITGHAQRQHPSSNRPLSNQRQPIPGQHSRPVLTPRVAHLCKGSGPSPGAGAVHGGTRKFPGPAGLLPKLTPGLKLKDAAVALKKKVEEETEEQLSQETEESSEEVTNVGDFEHGAWFLMKTELGIRDGDPNSILQQNNLALVIRKASLKQLTKNKVNHLCVMIKTISLNSSDASVSLCDPSGEMQGTIHRRLIEEYQGDLRPGSVLVLRQVGVLSPSQRNHYLNITPSNLIQVFPGESSSRPGSQQTPKRTRKRSGKTPSGKRSSEKGIPEHSRLPSTEGSLAPGRRDANDERLGSSDAVDVVTMDTDTYMEHGEDAGIWEEMLDDEDDEDVLLMDSQVGENDMRSRLDTRKEEPTENRDKHFDGVDYSKSTSGSSASSSSSKAVTTQISPAHQPSPTSSTTVTIPLTSTSSLTSSSPTGMVPIATKRCHPIPSKPTPSVLKHPEEMKRPCLRDISGLGSNTGGGNLTDGPNKGQKPAPNNFREESIGDLLDGLEDELFDDF
ncbi:uncharacterized protein C17orf53 homolog [Strongylocentrotus purpuratus]|uniref:Homologous recombination OB-fold protein OB-fold domain-containing protein n=1 Tax=Strongylocentrotus purpuratus TaxID=7668 RepID=A0A7M7P6N4_STRPU|nr:uncharacterized protein C17orf53 homolog [Strongylocentrotus purpuratus]